MSSLQTEVLVIGGGATGTGVVRDLAMRGFATILVEKGDLTNGTSGRYHGLLHSGGRYVVRDPHTAKECIQENQILRRIMPQCIEDTGGFFVLTPWDDPNYAPHFVRGCKQARIPVEEVPISLMMREEPLLNPRISQCLRVPDGSADSFMAAELNAASAREHGAHILTYHKVERMLIDRNHLVGVVCHDLVNDQEITIHADMVVNASGAWAGHITALLGLIVNIIPGKGTMIAMNHRIVNTVINRCKLPADGDILVPAHTVVVMGTTDVKVEDPDHFSIEPWEVQMMLEEGDKLVPGFRDMRLLRAWAGVRPLYQETDAQEDRDVTRTFVLLDHAERDGIQGLVTITSGKWTTYRRMAEATVDLVCKKLDVKRPCRTHLEVLPNSQGRGYHYLGARLEDVEQSYAYGKLVCECELATYNDVARAITEGEARTIDDVRRDVRLGMGPCQGGFCTYRVAGILHRLRRPEVIQTNVAIRDFLQERWKGLLPILWGQQLRQERLDELIYLSILNADHLPGPTRSNLASIPYRLPDSPKSHPIPTIQPELDIKRGDSNSYNLKSEKQTITEVLVIGAGLSGLTAAWQATTHGKRVRVIAKGRGALYWHTGCLDVFGYYPLDQVETIESPIEGISKLIQEEPEHPYALTGLDSIQNALVAFQQFSVDAEYPMHGSLERNWLLPSALGTKRPTCLAPETMIAGDLNKPDPMLIVGLEGFPDFYSELIADNLSAQSIPSIGITLDLDSIRNRKLINSRILAELFEKTEFQEEFTKSLKSNYPGHLPYKLRRLGLPAVLGQSQPLAIMHRLEDLLDLQVFEIPTLPPSIPGIRLYNLLVKNIVQASGEVFDGMEAKGADFDARGLLTAVRSEAASRDRVHQARKFVLATGGILGGGITINYEGQIREVVCDLPSRICLKRSDWFDQEFLSPSGHPIFHTGISVNGNFQPIDNTGQIRHENLYAIGTLLAYGDYIRERSFDGVSLVTGYLVGRRI